METVVNKVEIVIVDKGRNAGNMEVVIVDTGRNAGNMEMVIVDKGRNAGNMEMVIVDKGRNAGNMEMVIVDKGYNMYGFADEWFSSVISFFGKHSFILFLFFSLPYAHASTQVLVVGCNDNLLCLTLYNPFFC